MTANVNDEHPQPGVVRALAAVMEDVRGVGKGDFHNSPTAKFHFRGVDAVVNAVGPALRKHHVVVSPHLVSVDRRDVQTSGGKAARETCVVVRYVWTGPDGSTLETVVPGEAMDSGDKGTAKAMSVAFRIALLQALCLPTDEKDPDQDQYERETPHRQQGAVQGQRSQQPRNGAQNGHQGNGNGQRTSRPPADEPTADEETAMADLLAFVDGREWDRKAVAARYADQYKEDIRQATAQRLRAFLAIAKGWPADALRAEATNGAAQ